MGASKSTPVVDEAKPLTPVQVATLGRFHDMVRGDATLSRENFVKLLGLPGMEDFGQLLLSHYGHLHAQDALTEDDYLHVVTQALGSDDTTIIESRAHYVFMSYSHGAPVVKFDVVERILRMALTAALAAGGKAEAIPVAEDNYVIKSILAALKKRAKEDELTVDHFCGWLSQYCPHMFVGATKWVEMQCTKLPEAIAVVEDETVTASMHTAKGELDWCILHTLANLKLGNGETRLLDPTTVWLAAAFLPEKFRGAEEWTLLYNSSIHGKSANRFVHHTMMYKGPTLVLVEDTKGQRFGVHVDDEWKERHGVWGGEDCGMFFLAPEFTIIKETIKVYQNEKTRHQEHGIGFGPEPDSKDTALLWLENDFSKGLSRINPTLRPGEMEEFIPARVEVWGCGDSRLTELQMREKARDRLAVEQRQRAKRPTDWADSPDKVILNMVNIGVDHIAQIDVGREKAASTTRGRSGSVSDHDHNQ